MILPVLDDDERALLAKTRPTTPAELHAWLRLVAHVHLPTRAITEGASTPFTYLCHAFFEDRDEAKPRDCVVWAARGAGKTFLGAVATMLDLVFKPGVEVRILAGSLEQGRRMHAHLRALFASPALSGMVEGKVLDRRIGLVNGSVCEILAQSQTSVRGAHPQILRCDEVELFDPEVWEAAQLLPRSAVCGGVEVRAAVEAFSTMHKQGGVMASITSETESRRVFRWSALDVLEQCPAERSCAGCELEPECAGRAKGASGHVRIGDAITMKQRTSASVWETEMLCLRPTREDAVYPEFDAAAHVADFDADALAGGRWVAGMDFGFRSPTVILWAHVSDDGVVRVVDERSVSAVTLEKHIEALGQSRWPAPAWIGVDPAGRHRNDQTGVSAVTALRKAGHSVRDRRMALSEGIRLVRARLAPATGAPTLFVHRRCATLIDALTRYRWASERTESLTPVKDGADHACDALRYLVVGLDAVQGVRGGVYW